MSVFSYPWSMLDQNTRQPELMECMMARMVVNSVGAARIDGHMAWYEARTKCIFCRHQAQCRNWLKGSQGSSTPEFCPNIAFFRRCATPIPS